MDPLEYLSTLDDVILEQLERIVRTAAGMSEIEKQHTRVHIGVQTFLLAAAGEDDAQACAHLLAALGLIVTALDEAAQCGAVV